MWFKWILVIYFAYKFDYNLRRDPTGPDWRGVVVDIALTVGVLCFWPDRHSLQ